MNEYMITGGLAAIVAMVLTTPFLSHKVEKQLEAFLCANKLSIKSREWAMFGVPLGLTRMVGFFIFLLLVS